MFGLTDPGRAFRRAFLALALALSLAGPASAQGRDGAVAEALFREGRQAADQGDHERACSKFHESNRLDPALGTVFNIADCEEKLGHLATAWTLYQEVVQRLPAADERHAIAMRRAAALEPRIPRVTLRLAKGAPSGTTVFKDNVELGRASLESVLPVDPGEHTFVVKAPGRRAAVYKSRFSEGESKTLEVGPGGFEPVAAAVVGPGDGQRSRGGDTRVPGYVLGGIGIVGLGVGVVTGLMVIDRKSTADDNCTAEKRCSPEGMDAVESGRTLGTVSAIGFIAGAVGLGAGAYFVLSSKHDTSSRTALLGGPLTGGAAVAIMSSW